MLRLWKFVFKGEIAFFAEQHWMGSGGSSKRKWLHIVIGAFIFPAIGFSMGVLFECEKSFFDFLIFFWFFIFIFIYLFILLLLFFFFGFCGLGIEKIGEKSAKSQNWESKSKIFWNWWESWFSEVILIFLLIFADFMGWASRKWNVRRRRPIPLFKIDKWSHLLRRAAYHAAKWWQLPQ